jgi:hypothetical protein
MKNIFLIPTPNESRLWRDLDSNKLRFDNISKPNSNECTKCSNEYVYITTDSKFVRDEYITDGIEVIKATPKLVNAQGLVDRRDWKKIIITTDLELIKDGVHPIGEEFLKWFVLNPTCVKVEVVYGLFNPMGRQVDPNDLGQNHSKCVWKYKIITTKEEPKFENSIENTINIMDMANSMFGKKEEQKQHLIDMMKGDEELGLYDESREIKIEDIFNDEKREKVKRVILQHKVLQGLSLINPLHLRMTDNGHGEFPDGYKLTEKGIQYIIEQLNKEQDGK